jgi:hypothetical protein
MEIKLLNHHLSSLRLVDKPTPPRLRLIICNPDIPEGPCVAGNPVVRMTAAVHKLLIKHFDEVRGLYQPDWDDARVAVESGVHPAFVLATRCDSYGGLVNIANVAAE